MLPIEGPKSKKMVRHRQKHSKSCMVDTPRGRIFQLMPPIIIMFTYRSKAYPSPLGAYRPLFWPTHLKVLWAQRSDKILLTVKVDEIHDEEFSLEENRLHFSALSGSEDKHCEVIINFYNEIVPHVSQFTFDVRL